MKKREKELKAEAEKRENLLLEKAKAEKKAEKIETAKKLLKMGLSVDQVVEATDLSTEEVKKL